MMSQLTDRQREIKERLEQGMSAQKIGEDLEITRNAVYQQIQSLRRKGELPPGFTPSGAPTREAVAVTDGTLTEQMVRNTLRFADTLDRLADEMRRSVS